MLGMKILVRSFYLPWLSVYCPLSSVISFPECYTPPVSPSGRSKPSKATLDDRATFWGDPRHASAPKAPSSSATATLKKAPPNNTKVYRKIADSFEETQMAVQKFDKSEEGKERAKLDKKQRHSHKEITHQDTEELEALQQRRASLTRASNLAKKEKDEYGLSVAAKALDDFDMSEHGGRKRKKLMEKKNHSRLCMTPHELARLKELDDWRNTLANPRTQPQEIVAACRNAVKKFDESAEGKERSKLHEVEKQSREKLTSQDNADIEELSKQRKIFADARDIAKRAKDDHGIAVAKQQLGDFDASKTGRKLATLKTRRRWSQKELTSEEKARRKKLDKKRSDLELAKSGAGLEERRRTATSFSAVDFVGNDTKKRKRAVPEDGVDDDDTVSCGLCSGSIDIWCKFIVFTCFFPEYWAHLSLFLSPSNPVADKGIVSCSRVAICGATFHRSCYTTCSYDVNTHGGCIKCKGELQFAAKNIHRKSNNLCKTDVKPREHDSAKAKKTVANGGEEGPAVAQNTVDVIILDSDED